MRAHWCRSALVVLTVALAAAAGILSGRGAAVERASAQPIALRIGALVPLTGPLAWVGPGLLNAAQLAAQHINAAGGVLGGDVQIVQGDTQTDATAGVAEALRLIDEEGVTVIVGAAASGVTVPIAENATVPRGVLQISPASTSPQITALPDDDFLFRTALSDAAQGSDLAELATELGYETASTLYLDNPYGQGLSDVFVQEFEKLGGQVLAAIPHQGGQASYVAELQAATAGNPDVLAAISYPDDATVYLTQAMQNGYINEFLFVDGTKSQDMIDAVCAVVGAGCLDGMYGTAPAAPNGPAGLAFDAAYEAAYGEPPPVFASNTYDAVILAALAAEAAGSSDSSLVRNALRGVSRPRGEVVGLADGGIGHSLDLVRLGQDVNYEGASGCVDLDAHGDVICGATEIWRIESGTIVTVRIDPVLLTSAGDVDCEGDVDAVDALFILQYVVGLRSGSDQYPPPPGSIYLPAADVDDSGGVDAVDALFILQCILNLPPGNGLPFCTALP